MVVRIVSDNAAEIVEREARLLAFVAELTELPVPRPTAVDPEAGSLSYERLPGVPLIELGADVLERAVEKHVTNIFAKLNFASEPDHHRRVLAVLTYVKAAG